MRRALFDRQFILILRLARCILDGGKDLKEAHSCNLNTGIQGIVFSGARRFFAAAKGSLLQESPVLQKPKAKITISKGCLPVAFSINLWVASTLRYVKPGPT